MIIFEDWNQAGSGLSSLKSSFLIVLISEVFPTESPAKATLIMGSEAGVISVARPDAILILRSLLSSVCIDKVLWQLGLFRDLLLMIVVTASPSGAITSDGIISFQARKPIPIFWVDSLLLIIKMVHKVSNGMLCFLMTPLQLQEFLFERSYPWLKFFILLPFCVHCDLIPRVSTSLHPHFFEFFSFSLFVIKFCFLAISPWLALLCSYWSHMYL